MWRFTLGDQTRIHTEPPPSPPAGSARGLSTNVVRVQNQALARGAEARRAREDQTRATLAELGAKPTGTLAREE